MNHLLSLAIRIEALSCSDREVDAEIAVALRHGAYHEPEDTGYPTMIRKDDYEADARKRGAYWFHSRSGISMRTAIEYTENEFGRRAAARMIREIAEQGAVT